MVLDNLLDKAKESAGNLADKAKESASSIKEKAADKFLEIKENFLGEEEKEIEEEFKENNSSKLKDTIQKITDSITLINKSGYEFKGIGANLGLSLGMNLTFHFTKDISDEDREALLIEAEDKKFIKLILKMLFKADDFYRSIKLGSYELDTVNITLGLAPGMSLSFKKMS
jgi:vacuolar-type H+-ATPase subunit H